MASALLVDVSPPRAYPVLRPVQGAKSLRRASWALGASHSSISLGMVSATLLISRSAYDKMGVRVLIGVRMSGLRRQRRASSSPRIGRCVGPTAPSLLCRSRLWMYRSQEFARVRYPFAQHGTHEKAKCVHGGKLTRAARRRMAHGRPCGGHAYWRTYVS